MPKEDVIENLNFSKNELYQLTIDEKLDLIKKELGIVDEKGNYYDVVPSYIVGAEEETKAGFLPAEIFRAADEIAGLDRLKVKGIMTVAPFTDDTDYLKQVFTETYSVFEKLRDGNYGEFDIKWLSMGMSGDYELAIEHGANMVRIGSSIFGMRSYL